MSAPTPIPLWIDCDPGHDDAMMLILAGHCGGAVNVLGVSTVAGNMPLSHTTANALKVLYISGNEHIPVVAGAAKPLIRPLRTCPEIHGESGLDGHEIPPLPPTLVPVEGKAVNVTAERILSHWKSTGQRVVLLATGCLTNVAILLIVYPEIKEALDKIVIMGGAIGRGNTHPVAEFNIEIDPDAAKVVFTSGVHVHMVPLEVTHTALATPAVFARIAALKSPFATLVIGLLKFFADTYNSVFGMPDPPLHDPCALYYITHPQHFHTKTCHVDIETASTLCAGQTVVDLLNIRGRTDPPNATVALTMDVDKFWDAMIDALTHANAVSIVNKQTTTTTEAATTTTTDTK